MAMFNITHHAALKKIAKEFDSDIDLTSIKKIETVKKSDKEFDLGFDNWDNINTLRYWKNYLVTKSTLIKFNVVPLKWLMLKGSVIN